MSSKLIIYVLIVMLLMTGGVVFAVDEETQSAEDLPKAGITPASPFYFLDRVGETIREFLTFNAQAKARLQITFAAERIAEIKVTLEAKGVEARGLDVAQARLAKHTERAAGIVEEEKAKGEDVSALAGELRNKLDEHKSMLGQAFEEKKQILKKQEISFEEELEVAHREGDTEQEERLTVEIGRVKGQVELVELREKDLEEKLEREIVELREEDLEEKKEPSPVPVEDIEARPEIIQTMVDANNQFTFELYSELKTLDSDNIFFSPYSISTALGMTYEGAKGQTADEIRSVFHFPENIAVQRSGVAAIYDRLNKKDADYELHTANALWVQQGYAVLDTFTDAVKKYYGGQAENVDFIGASGEVIKIINGWVSDWTNGKIKKLFSEGSINEFTRLVLTNAVYFKGTWVKQFDEDNTWEEDFRVSGTETVRVPMMRRMDKEAVFGYAETEEVQVLEMPYEGEDLSMLVFLPKGDDIAHLERLLNVGQLRTWKSQLKEQRVKVFIPRFTFTSKYLLNEALKSMGMPLAFTPPSREGGADFSGISKWRDLFIAIVIHQAFVDVNEEGTEAAAATGVGMEMTAIEPSMPVFHANHPFIFLIQDKETGNILFIGRVIDPSI